MYEIQNFNVVVCQYFLFSDKIKEGPGPYNSNYVPDLIEQQHEKSSL
jgi:hypothetical protein